MSEKILYEAPVTGEKLKKIEKDCIKKFYENLEYCRKSDYCTVFNVTHDFNDLQEDRDNIMIKLAKENKLKLTKINSTRYQYSFT